MGFFRNAFRKLRKAVDPVAIIAGIMKKHVACVSFAYGDTCYAPGCSSGFKKANACSNTTKSTTNTDKFQQFMESALGDEFRVISLEMANDWVNGSIYFPLWNWYKTKKKKYLFGLITKRAKNDFCSAQKTYENLKMRELCVESKLHDKVDSKLGNGVIYNTTNADGLDLYYYSVGTYNENKHAFHRLFATDIILLGSFNDCDTDGIPPLYKYLPDTSANIPPFISSKDMGTNESEDSQDEFSPDDNGEIVTTGMFWSNSKDPTDGLLFSLNCMDYTTKPKTCVNLDRVCELGVTLDGRYFDTHYRHDVFPDGFIKKDELQDMDIRAMFATLNSNGLTEKYVDPQTLYEKYKFQYLYSTNFDGKLQDTKDADYIKFRYGDVLGNNTPNRFYIKNNSFYFYFGLKPGNTAIDKFKRMYDAECEEEIIGSYSVSVSGIGRPICTNRQGDITFTVQGAKLPYSYQILDKDDTVLISQDNVMDKTIVLENQFDNDIYTIKVQDGNNEIVAQSVVVTIPFDDPSVLFEKKELTDYYIAGQPFQDDDYGHLTISGCNIYNVDERFVSVSTTDNRVFSCRTSNHDFIVTLKSTDNTAFPNMTVSIEDNSIVCSGITPCTFMADLQYFCEHNNEYMDGQETLFSFSNGKIAEVFLNDVPLSFFESSSFTSPISAISGINMYSQNVWCEGIEDPNSYSFPTFGALWEAYLFQGFTALDKAQYQLACIANICQAAYYTDDGSNTFVLSAPNRKEFKKEILFPNYGSTEISLEDSNNNNYLLINNSTIQTWSYLNGVTEVTCSGTYPNIIHGNIVFSNAKYNLKNIDTHTPFNYLFQIYNSFSNNETSIVQQTASTVTHLNRNGKTTALISSFNPLICKDGKNISHNYFRVTDSKKNKKYPSNSTDYTSVQEENTQINVSQIDAINSKNWLRADFNDKTLLCTGQIGYSGGTILINLNLDGGLPLAYDADKNIIGDNNLEYSIVNGELIKNDTSNGKKRFYELYFSINGETIVYTDYVVKTYMGGTFTSNIKTTITNTPLSSITNFDLHVTDCSYNLNLVQQDETLKAYTTPGRTYIINLLNKCSYTEGQYIVEQQSLDSHLQEEPKYERGVSAHTQNVVRVMPDTNTYMMKPRESNGISWVSELRNPIHYYGNDNHYKDYALNQIADIDTSKLNAAMYLSANPTPYIGFIKGSFGVNDTDIIFDSSDSNSYPNMDNPMYFKTSASTQQNYAFVYQSFDDNSVVDFINYQTVSAIPLDIQVGLSSNTVNNEIQSVKLVQLEEDEYWVTDVEMKGSNGEILSFANKDYKSTQFSSDSLYSITIKPKIGLDENNQNVYGDEETYYIIQE